METITFQNIKVDGLPYTKITELKIDQILGEHGTAYVVGEMKAETAKDTLSRINEKTAVMIKTSASGQPPILFVGVISQAKIEHQGEYSLFCADLVSTSALLDIQKNNKSFQNTGKTYGQILNEAYGGCGTIQLTTSDRPIGNLIVQYNETNWEFTKRMAATLGAPIVAKIDARNPYVFVGMPTAKRTVTINSSKQSVSMTAIKAGVDTANVNSSANAGAKSYQYAFIGDRLSMGGVTQVISGIHCNIQDGMLVTSYESTVQTGYKQPIIVNKQASGKMFTGTVMAVEKDKVQVHLVDIDASYDGGGNHWFPYSTAYSSQDGSGFYCMPAVGDTVRVFFPSNNEKDAFAASSVNVSPLDNVKHKKWKTPGGKEILMTEEGLFITCKENKVYINLVDEDGISIYSEKDIKVLSKTNINIEAKEKLIMYAENEMYLGTDQSYIDLTKNKIALGGQSVIIN